MNRSSESRGANGVGQEQSSREPNEPREPRDEWRRYAQERSEDPRYGYGYGSRANEWPRSWHEAEERERFRIGHLPPPSPLPPREVWRGRNEDYDFWGRERHPLHGEAHPSLWQRVKGAFTGKGPKNYVRSDERIREDVCEHLSYHPYIDASDIEVVVREGEVTLSGTVDARMVKRAAEECCDHVRGVRDVHNQLRVRAQGEPAP